MTAATSTARRLPTPELPPAREPDLWPRRRFVVVPRTSGPDPDHVDLWVEPGSPPAAAPSPSRPSASVYRRRRTLAVLAAVAIAASLLTAARAVPSDVPATTTSATVDVPAATTTRTATVAPGSTLWDIAVTHAPAGMDPRAYLAHLRDLNGFDGADVPAWTVVLLPDVRRPD